MKKNPINTLDGHWLFLRTIIKSGDLSSDYVRDQSFTCKIQRRCVFNGKYGENLLPLKTTT